MKKLIFLFSLVLFSSCNKSQKTGDGNQNSDSIAFFEIDVTNSLNNKRPVKLSQVASDVYYIKLETTEDCMLRTVVRYYFTDSSIFVRNFDHILKFDPEGKFIQRIGASGRGPGEIDLIRNLSVIPEKKTLVVQKNFQRELLYFSFSGNLLNSINYEQHIEALKILPDGHLLTYESGATGKEDIMFCLMKDTWDTLSTISNYGKWTSIPSAYQIMIGYPVFEPFYISQNRFHMKSMYNDTVYCVLNDRIIPDYFLDLGKYKLPAELRPERLGPEGVQKFMDNRDRYFFPQVFETARNIFINLYNYGNGESARLLLFDKSAKESIALAKDDNLKGGFINDWDGGVSFWPIGQINDNQVYMPVSPLDLKKFYSEKRSENPDIKYPKKRDKLSELVSKLNETDNPVLMVVTLKTK